MVIKTTTNYGTRNPIVYASSIDSSIDSSMDSSRDSPSDSESKHTNATTCQQKEDVTTKLIGSFGKWQCRMVLMMTLLKLPTAWFQLNIVFLAPPIQFWCAKPSIFASYSTKFWREICTPTVEEYPCLIFDPDILINDVYIDRVLVPLVKCQNFTYDTSVFKSTIISEWDLVCDNHWMTHGAQVLMMWGILIGGILFGYMADKRGRKSTLMLSIIIQSVSSLLSGLTPTFTLFMINRFFIALACGGISVISFVICMEVVSGKWRTIVPVLYQVPFGLGNAIMALISYLERDWRKFELGLGILTSLYVVCGIWMTESPRWLLATGQTENALVVLRAAACTNGRNFDEDLARSLMSQLPKKKEPSLMAFIRLKNMRKKTILLSMNWFCTGLAFYSFSQYIGLISVNVFFAVALAGIISVPGGLVCVFVVVKFGRKITLIGFQLTTGVCFLIIMFIPRDIFVNDWPILVFAGIGMAGLGGCVPAMYLFSGELYPTLGRNVGVGAVSTFARLGSMVAPMVVATEYYVPNAPLVLMAVMSFCQTFIVLALPETHGCPLPDNLEEAEAFNNNTHIKIREMKKTAEENLVTVK